VRELPGAEHRIDLSDEERAVLEVGALAEAERKHVPASAVSEAEETSANVVVVAARERLKNRQRAALSEVHLFSLRPGI
jgi:hypothetical protein